MSIIQPRSVVIGLLFIFTLLSGVWLSSSGKPLNVAIFTIHKLIALTTVIAIAVTIYQLRSGAAISSIGWIAVVVTGFLFLAMFVTGALLSIIQPTNAAVLTIHRVIPFLVAIATAVTVYLIANVQP